MGELCKGRLALLTNSIFSVWWAEIKVVCDTASVENLRLNAGERKLKYVYYKKSAFCWGCCWMFYLAWFLIHCYLCRCSFYEARDIYVTILLHLLPSAFIIIMIAVQKVNTKLWSVCPTLMRDLSWVFVVIVCEFFCDCHVFVGRGQKIWSETREHFLLQPHRLDMRNCFSCFLYFLNVCSNKWDAFKNGFKTSLQKQEKPFYLWGVRSSPWILCWLLAKQKTV